MDLNFELKHLFKIFQFTLYNLTLSTGLAAIYLVGFFIQLPPTDGAKQSGILFFIDPFVWTVILFACGIISLVSLPLVTWMFWNDDMKDVYGILFLSLLPLTITVSIFCNALLAFEICCAGAVCAVFFTKLIVILRKQMTEIE